MSKVYGQNPTSAISAVRRYDEFAGSLTQQDNDLVRKQDAGQIGQTLPLTFCWREGGDGGVWISPRLVGLAFKGEEIHLTYLISEGKTGPIRDEEIWIGDKKLTDIPLGASSRGYEEVPAGTEIMNVPGKIPSVNFFHFYSNPLATLVISATANCTGMEFVLQADDPGDGSIFDPGYEITVKVYDAKEGYNEVERKTLTFTGLTQTQGITGLPPSQYQFTVEVANRYIVRMVGTIEHYKLDDDDVAVPPTYKNMTLLGVRGLAYDFLNQDTNFELAQIHAFVRDGIYVEDVRSTGAEAGPTSLYPNLVNYLMRNALKLDVDLVDLSSLALIANMNHKYNLWFNGVMAATSSFQEWIFRTAPYFWASPAQINGKYGLAPVVPLSPDGTVKTSATALLELGLDQIIEGSYNMVMESSKERQDFCCVMVYKGSVTRSISETKTVEVRFKGAALEGPYETHDLTEFCIDQEHAIRAAMYILARRRYVTHTLNVTIRPQTVQLNPGDIVKANLEIIGGTKNKYFYQVDSISEGPDGLVSLVLTHFPVNDQGQSLIALAMTQELSGELTQGRSGDQNRSNDLFVWQ